MEYKKIEEFIKAKVLQEAALIKKKIIYSSLNSLAKFGVEIDNNENLAEYEILEIVPAKTNYIKALMKLRTIGLGKPEEIWTYVTIKNIKFVKIEPEKDRDVEKSPGLDNWLDILKKKKEAEDENNKMNPWKDPKYPFPNKPYCNRCSLCGLDCSGPLGYCCPNENCPVGLGPILCSTVTKDTSCKTVTISPECGNDPDAYKTVCGDQTTLDSMPIDRNTLD